MVNWREPWLLCRSGCATRWKKESTEPKCAGTSKASSDTIPPLLMTNMAMEAMVHRNRSFSQLEISIYGWGFSIAMLDNQMANFFKSAGTSGHPHVKMIEEWSDTFFFLTSLRISGTCWKLRGFHGSQWLYIASLFHYFSPEVCVGTNICWNICCTPAAVIALLCSPRGHAVFVQCWSSKSHPEDLVGFY